MEQQIGLEQLMTPKLKECIGFPDLPNIIRPHYFTELWTGIFTAGIYNYPLAIPTVACPHAPGFRYFTPPTDQPYLEIFPYSL